MNKELKRLKRKRSPIGDGAEENKAPKLQCMFVDMREINIVIIKDDAHELSSARVHEFSRARVVSVQ